MVEPAKTDADVRGPTPERQVIAYGFAMRLACALSLPVFLFGTAVAVQSASRIGVLGLGLMAVWACLLAGYGRALVGVFRGATILDPDWVEVVSAFSRRRVARARIRGYRIQSGSPAVIRFEVDGGEPLRASLFTTYTYKKNVANIEAWLPGLSSLDRDEGEAFLIALDRAGLKTKRLAQIKRGDRIVRALYYLGLVLTAAILIPFTPREVALVAGLIAPLAGAALAVWWRRLMTFDGLCMTGGQAGVTLFLAGGALGWRSLTDGLSVSATATNLLDWPEALILCVSLGVAAMISLWAIVRPNTEHAMRAGILALAFFLWGVGVVFEANTVLDRGAGTVYVAQVSAKLPPLQAWRRLTLAPWGPRPKGEVLNAPGLYSAVEPGDYLCIAVHPGALGIRWYHAQLCD